MTVYLPKGGKTWWFDYWLKGRRYRGSTGQLRQTDAEIVEGQIKLRQRQALGGIAPFEPDRTPTFDAWAEMYAEAQAKQVGRSDVIDRTLRVVLEFWGSPPATPTRRPTGTNTRRIPAPYHHLRLGHPIADPTWIVTFEAWIAARGVSGSTRNSYLSVLSGLYKLARQPEYRAITNVPSNPFAEIRRSPTNDRAVALSPDQVRAWIAAAPHHIRIAMAIAALAPKLRLSTILALEWAVHLDRDVTAITVERHKTRRRTKLPQVTPIGPQLHAILLAQREAYPGRYVVSYYKGKPVKDIKKGARRAAEDAGLTWGVSAGVTFHTLRHSIATLLAKVGIGERLRMEIMGHTEIRTTQKYTHLAATDQIAPHAQLDAALTIQDSVLSPPDGKTPFRKSRQRVESGA